MLIIIDKRIPEEAKKNLSKYGEIFELETYDIVYDAISCHPDIFIFQHNNKLIIAPQSPKKLIDKLKQLYIEFQFGSKNLSNKYPATAYYNVANNDNLFIGNMNNCTSEILELSKDKTWIQSKQSYSYCNNIILSEEHIITNDIKVQKQIKSSLFIKPEEIILPGFDYGFIGGCSGVIDKNLFLIGSLNHHSQGDIIKEYIKDSYYKLIELYDGPLFDGGGIFFIK